MEKHTVFALQKCLYTAPCNSVFFQKFSLLNKGQGKRFRKTPCPVKGKRSKGKLRLTRWQSKQNRAFEWPPSLHAGKIGAESVLMRFLSREAV